MPFLPEQKETVLTCSRASLHVHASQPGTGSNGQETTLVFLHFYGGTSRTWQPVLQELDLEFPCVAVDLRGFGETVVTEAAEEVSSYSLDLMAADVTEVIGQLELKRYVLVGHSMGGKLALALAAGYGCPPGLVALVLVAPSPPTPEPMPEAERARLLAGLGSKPAAYETLSKITAQPLSAALVEMAVEDELRVMPPAGRAWLERGSRVDLSARLERIEVPVFLLAGEKDANITARLLQREIADRLPSGHAREPETVPDAAHLLPLEAPSAVADFIRRAVAGSAR